MENPESFKSWLVRRYANKNSIVGDFASDVKGDKNFPEVNDRATIHSYLIKVRACTQAINTFEKLWKRYEKLDWQKVGRRWQ